MKPSTSSYRGKIYKIFGHELISEDMAKEIQDFLKAKKLKSSLWRDENTLLLQFSVF